MNCKHEWIDLKDGTRDKICLKCGKKAMQGAMHYKQDGVIPIATPDDVISKIAKDIAKRIRSQSRIGGG